MYTFCQALILNILRKKWKFMNLKNMFLRGTLLLTAAGIISRIMGFFYRIFLANTIGAEGMGIYQLIFPIYVFRSEFSIKINKPSLVFCIWLIYINAKISLSNGSRAWVCPNVRKEKELL